MSKRQFTEIAALRNVMQAVRLRATYIGKDELGVPQYKEFDENIDLPTIRYRGTVKVHGTNAGVRLAEDGTLIPSSRTRDISLQDDNYGFAAFALESVAPSVWKELLQASGASAAFGEWCGPGVNRGEAIHKVESRRFVVFALRREDGSWAALPEIAAFEAPEHGIYSIAREGVRTFEIAIDFNDPTVARDEIDRVTQDVGAACPLGEHFGVEGHGEGIVWVPIDTDTYDERFWFKSKATRHKERASKKSEPTPIDPEVMASIEEFVTETANDVRLEKGIAALLESGIPATELSRRHTGEFLKWVAKDILKEEADVIEASGLQWNPQLASPVCKHASTWFSAYLDRSLLG